MKIVWFKRDLRLHDHEALHEALSTSGKTLLLYIFEPSLMKDYHYSQRHFDFIKQSLEALQKELIKKATGKEDYNKIADEIFRLRELRNASTMAGVTRDEQIKRINDLQDFIKEQKVEVSEFDEALVRRLIEKIMVFDDYFEVEFKSGVKVNIKG